MSLLRPIVLFVVFIFIAILSCERPRNSLITRQYIDSSGKVISEIPYINDSIKHGLAKYFFENGNTSTEAMYKHGKLHGITKTYSVSGQLRSLVNFMSDMREGECFWYYENGNIKEKSNWSNDKRIGNAYFYFQNGKLRTFTTFDFDENPQYLIKFDSTGKMLREEGRILGQFKSIENLDSIPLNKPIELCISVSEPPQMKVSVVFGKYVNKQFVKMGSIPVKGNIAMHKINFTEYGTHNIVFVGRLSDQAGHVLKCDSMVAVFKVIENVK